MPDRAVLNWKGQCTGNAKTAKTTRRQRQWLEGDTQGDPQDTSHVSKNTTISELMLKKVTSSGLSAFVNAQ